MDPRWFEETLYPLQDEVLAVAARVETGFYLTGGTALGNRALLDRQEPKDLADVWGLCRRGGLALGDALVGASSKAVGVFAADVARVLLGATADDWRLVRWIAPAPPSEEVLRDLNLHNVRLCLVCWSAPPAGKK